MSEPNAACSVCQGTGWAPSCDNGDISMALCSVCRKPVDGSHREKFKDPSGSFLKVSWSPADGQPGEPWSVVVFEVNPLTGATTFRPLTDRQMVNIGETSLDPYCQALIGALSEIAKSAAVHRSDRIDLVERSHGALSTRISNISALIETYDKVWNLLERRANIGIERAQIALDRADLAIQANKDSEALIGLTRRMIAASEKLCDMVVALEKRVDDLVVETQVESTSTRARLDSLESFVSEATEAVLASPVVQSVRVALSGLLRRFNGGH
jgi:hypothetical protein